MLSKTISSTSDSSIEDSRLQKIYERARSKFLNSQYKDSLNLIRESIKPIEDFETFQNLGSKLCDSFEVKKIASKLYRLKAFVELKSKFNKKPALTSLEKAISFNPKHLGLYYEKARLLDWLGEPSKALEVIQTTLDDLDSFGPKSKHFYVIVDMVILKTRLLEALHQSNQVLPELEKLDIMCSDSTLLSSLRKAEFLFQTNRLGECLREIDYLELSSSQETLTEYGLLEMKKNIPSYMVSPLRTIPGCNLL